MNNKDRLILEYLCEKYTPEVIEEGFLKKLSPYVAGGLLTLGGIAINNHINSHNDNDIDNSTQEVVIPLSKQIPNYDELVSAVKDYMSWAVKCVGHDYSEIEITPEKLVELSYEYQYDLPMLLAALHLESHFGITPRAKRTNSPCSVGCWDNGQNRAHYNNQNAAVEDYIQIMQDNFIRGRSLADAFSNGGLVNGIGKRYASDKKYEQKLRSLRTKAIKNFPELEKQIYAL